MNEAMTFIVVCGAAGLAFGFLHGLGKDSFEWLSRRTYKNRAERVELEISVDSTGAIAAVQEVTRLMDEMRSAARAGEYTIEGFKIGAGT